MVTSLPGTSMGGAAATGSELDAAQRRSAPGSKNLVSRDKHESTPAYSKGSRKDDNEEEALICVRIGWWVAP
jgi:hypothetical protein